MSAWWLQHSDHRPDHMPNVRKQKNCIGKQKKKSTRIAFFKKTAKFEPRTVVSIRGLMNTGGQDTTK